MKIKRITIAILVLLTFLLVLDMRSDFWRGFNDGWIGSMEESGVKVEVNLENFKGDAAKTTEFIHAGDRFNTLKIDNAFGYVDLKMARGNELKIIFTIEVADETEAKAREKLDKWNIEEQIRGSEVQYKLDGKVQAKDKLRSNLVVEIPEGMNVFISQSFGQIIVADVTSTLDLDINFGDVKASDLKGDLKIDSAFSTVDLKNIMGAIKADAAYSTINLTLKDFNEGYDFKIEQTFGTLTENLGLTRIDKDTSIQASGKVGNGAHLVKIESNFGTTNLKLID